MHTTRLIPAGRRCTLWGTGSGKSDGSTTPAAQGAAFGVLWRARQVTAIRPAPDPTPFSQAQLDAAEKTAAAAVKAAADRAAAAYGA